MHRHWKPLAAIGAAMPRSGRDRTARRTVGLDAALDVRAQGLNLLGCLRPIDLGLLRIAEFDAARRRRLGHGVVRVS